MNSTAEAMMRAYDQERIRHLIESGQIPPIRPTRDSAHNPNYGESDPFYGGPLSPVSGIGSATMRFADVARPDLGQGLPA